ncbi:uncharacterized protein A1O9_08952 [Exophiala aquamarina CBS 119918]|uniref:Potassium channel domain-containing protein n=1 Tax=Exophiala aquamarina CBS 119918 TaxID=1182545 RepID=A0A072P7R4_9EURO|nr:uncharacterized protein A1O9_08952 [Exophiala aquamarina CBS 119918]KEF55298.1 hypothetical protein A1O9_08952 [Exophiala aquamarina CBS 119918]
MGYDHAEQKELDAPVSNSSSSSGASIGEKRRQWDEPDQSRDSITTLPDEKGRQEKDFQKKHGHSLGKLRLRSADDDQPTDWWFASTAIPLIAATFAPMANLLSIAALVVSWRNNVIEPENDITYQSTSVPYPDPRWCINLNIASLVCGFVGNLFLLFNFTKRIRYIVALPGTIIFFYLASGILIGITVSMDIHDPPGVDQIYSQGFWNAVLAACLYMFNSMILMINMWGYFLGHYPQHFALSDEQRNLILQTMMFFIWLGGGAAIFSKIEPAWSYPDALYFCDVTILTIGFGDYYPTDDVGRGLVFPYSVGGTIILGLMVSSIHKFAGELSTVNVLRKHIEARRVNTLSRVVTVDKEEEKRNTLEAEFEQLRHHHLPISAPLPNPQIQRDLDAAAASADEENRQERHIEFTNSNAETPKKEDVPEEEHHPHPHQFLNSAFHNGPIRKTLRLITKQVNTMKKARTGSQKVILMREEKDRFDAMRNIQLNAKKFKKWYALMVSVIAFGILWCAGAIVFWRAERRTQDMSYFEALYFCYVSLLTIGYGDLSPKSNPGKAFFVVWSLIAVPTMTILISDMGDTVISSFKRGTFKLGDVTVLPKAGLWNEILKRNQWLWNWMSRKAEKNRRKTGLPVGPAQCDGLPNLTIEELANETPSEAEMTKRLVWAIRKTAEDLQHAPGTQYSYEQWCEFTRLIRFSKTGLSRLDYDEDRDGVVEWDWLEESSPMLSGQTEPEWILDRLCESLLRLLKRNMLDYQSAPNSAFPTSASTDPSMSNLSRQNTSFNDEWWNSKIGDSTDKGKAPDQSGISPREERQRRASGADAILTFFTGNRRGTHTYASDAPLWSKKAQEKQKERRRSSTMKKRRGPFSQLQHSERTGPIGGARGGAGLRTLKMRHFAGDGTGARGSRRREDD